MVKAALVPVSADPSTGARGGPEGERRTNHAEHENGYQTKVRRFLLTRHVTRPYGPFDGVRVGCSLDAIIEGTAPNGSYVTPNYHKTDMCIPQRKGLGLRMVIHCPPLVVAAPPGIVTLADLRPWSGG